MVGDSITDIRTARAAECAGDRGRFRLYRRAGRDLGPDRVISSYRGTAGAIAALAPVKNADGRSGLYRATN